LQQCTCSLLIAGVRKAVACIQAELHQHSSSIETIQSAVGACDCNSKEVMQVVLQLKEQVEHNSAAQDLLKRLSGLPYLETGFFPIYWSVRVQQQL